MDFVGRGLAVKSIAAFMLAVALPCYSLAQTAHHHQNAADAPHMSQSAPTIVPTEPGQGAFAAIAEIVATLRADPSTDWSRVDVTALRQHLVDMDRLILEAEVVERPVPSGLEIEITLRGAGGEAAGRMVPAHGPVLAAETGWQSSVTEADDRLIWMLTSQEDEAQIRALGFFGLMAVGDHHREHHLGIAKGSMRH